MTTLIEPQVVWEETNDLGQPVSGVATVRLANPTGGWLHWGSEDLPVSGSLDGAEQSHYRPLDLSLTIFGSPRKRPEIEAFEHEYAAFMALPPNLVSRYSGRFVAVHHGSVVDSDLSRDNLVRRFFTRFGDASVYIDYVGQPVVAYQVTPFQI